jgi:hypothetical protein
MPELQTVLSSGDITEYNESGSGAGDALQTLDEINALLDVTELHTAMYLNTNTNAQTPVADQVIGITNFTAVGGNGFAFEAGEDGTFSGTADNGTDVTITCGGAHTVDVGDYVVIYQSSSNGSYDITGTYLVTADGGTTFDIAYANWDASEVGIWQSPSQLKLTAAGISSINFLIGWNLSASAGGSPAGDLVDWVVYKNSTEYAQTEARRTLSNAGNWGNFGGGGIIPLSTDDIIYLTFHSDDVNAITHRYGSLRIVSLHVGSS